MERGHPRAVPPTQEIKGLHGRAGTAAGHTSGSVQTDVFIT